ncbi:lamin tail domain-containing protein, partial [bacterium]|nr:lamin tail domain-containing protein [bacterium]
MLIIFLCLTALLFPRITKAQLLINEIYATPASGQEEWLEIYNPTSQAVSLAGWQIAESSGTTVKNFEPLAKTNEATLSAYGFYDFVPAKVTLNNGGDTIYLFAPDNTQADSVTYPKLSTDQSYARLTDGDASWDVSTFISRGSSNYLDLAVVSPDEVTATASSTPVSTSTSTVKTTTASKATTTKTTTTATSATNNNSATAATTNKASPTPVPQAKSWRDGIEFQLPKLTYATPKPQATPLPQPSPSPQPQILGVSTTQPSAHIQYNFPLLLVAGFAIILGGGTLASILA